MSGIPKDLVIAIDGPVAAGKTTTARLLARRLGYCHIDSGAIYRALAWKALQQAVDLSSPTVLANMLEQTTLELQPVPAGLRVLVDGEDVTESLRLPKTDTASSILSTYASVREEMVRRQRELGAQGGVVMDGRDIGTVVFPHAAVKFYLTASLKERGRRRFLESPQGPGTLESTLEEVESRDRRDMERAVSPLKPAPDAILIDTTFLRPEEVVRQMEDHICRKFKNSHDFFLA
ncbi:MAG: (d)CMP kinase [Candidatus Methylomirabilales bacterium]